MDPRWGLAVLVGVCLVQLPAMVWLARRVELGEEGPWRTGAPGVGTPAGHSVAVEPGAATTPCPRCGTTNEPAYTYCRDCLARL